MTKLSQLTQIRSLKVPTAPFVGLSYEAYQAGTIATGKLSFPVVVRSTYSDEDSGESSMAGHFQTILDVEQEGLASAVQEVFDSYPTPENQSVIIQEQIPSDYSGVLFAYRKGVWKLELVKGFGENLVSGKETPQSIILPRFTYLDSKIQHLYRIWNSALTDTKLEPAIMSLSYYAQRLLDAMAPEHGLDIEFAIVRGQLYVLQARPITTPQEAEEVLSSANHKEILPAYPSHLMTDIIVQNGHELYQFYESMDSSLQRRRFIEEAAGMPWINLSALLDLVVYWGIPTSVVCRSVGAEDFYRVRFRLHRAIFKIPVFWKGFIRQSKIRGEVNRWLARHEQSQQWEQRQRETMWEAAPEEAFEQWVEAFSQLYVELVSLMQVLTGAMSGPVNLLNRLGLLTALSDAAAQKSTSQDYLESFNQLQNGQIDRSTFVARFGHRGFYESDLGQKRFSEYTEAEWQHLLPDFGEHLYDEPVIVKRKNPWWTRLFSRIIELMHTREHLRNESMKRFAQFRFELLQAVEDRPGPGFDPFAFKIKDLHDLFAQKTSLAQLHSKPFPEQSGWDMDTFLVNRLGRRLPLPTSGTAKTNKGIGIYPGKIRGQVWRVATADFEHLSAPPFEQCILVAEALDPGWIPFFSQVDGVISYVGGLLSHASIILRESRTPSITQLPRHIDLQTGDWIEMDGMSGSIKKLEMESSADFSPHRS